MLNKQNLPSSIHVGTDIVEVSRIKRAIINSPERFLAKVFTESEIRLAKEDYERFAGFWAAKEAAVKALGTGFQQQISFHDVEIIHDTLGAPNLIFSGKFAELATRKGLKSCSVSISHTKQVAIAVVILG